MIHKIIRLKYIGLYGTIIMMMLCVGCSSKNKKPVESQKIQQEDTDKIELDNQAWKENLKSKYDIGMTGENVYEDMPTLDENGQVVLLSIIGETAKIKNQNISYMKILGANEEFVVLHYQSLVEGQEYGEDMFAEALYDYHIVCLDRKNNSVKNEIKFTNSYADVSATQSAIIIEQYSGIDNVVESYDYSLEFIGRLSLSTGATGHLTTDGKRYYYIYEGVLYCNEMESGSCSTLDLDKGFKAETVVAVITDGDSDYAIINGTAGDYKEYQIILDVNDNKLVRVDEIRDRFFEVSQDVYVKQCYKAMNLDYWLVGASAQKAFEYRVRNAELDESVYVVDKEHILFTCGAGKSIVLALYNQEDGTCINSTKIDLSEYLPQLLDSYLDDVHEVDEIFLRTSPIYIADNILLVQLADLLGGCYYLAWETQNFDGAIDNGFVDVEKHQLGSLQSAEISTFEGLTLEPGEVIEALKPLKEKANKLEEKYNVDIYISEECSNMLGGYVVHSLNDYGLVEAALDALDKEMAKYPDNFFTQFNYDWVNGLHIYIASDLLGSSEGIMSTVGGFQMDSDVGSLIVIDCNDIDAMKSTFHHELCHAIETKICVYEQGDSGTVLSAIEWNAMNTCGDVYTYSSEVWYDEDYSELIYENIDYTGVDISEICFIDAYSMSYPREDRARIFESIMSDSYDIDYESADILREKLNYYAKCIRTVFDTTGWEDVPWELYLK